MLDAPRPLLPEILALHGQWRASHAAIIAPDATLNWQEFHAAIRQVANGLRGLGIGHANCVGVVMANGCAMVEVMLGAICAGATVVPINLSVTDISVEAMLRDAGIRALFVTDSQLARADSIRHRILTLDENGLFCVAGKKMPPPPWQDYREWRTKQAQDQLDIAIGPNTPCNIIYSSGTTGVPKGIVHTHQNRLDWAYDIALALRYHSGVRTLVSLGLYSNISWAMMLCTLLTGGTLVLLEGFDEAAVARTIEEQRITHLAMVPIQFRRLLDHPEFNSFDRTTMQAMMACGSPLGAPLKSRIFDAFRCGIIELYGLTEGVITTLDPEDAAGRYASVGKPIPGTDIRLIDAEGREVPTGAPGEIVGLCRFIMPGYWNRPEATEEATWLDERGRKWFRTGDIGRVDSDGFLYIVDRKKDMILSGGQNVYPADIEEVLISHKDVAECAVIGVPHSEWGETPLAVVVPRNDASTAQAIREWVNERVGKQQRVSAVVFLTALPRNPNGKILKRELRSRYTS